MLRMLRKARKAATLLLLPLLVLSLLVSSSGCTASDPITDDVYVKGDLFVWDGATWINVNSGAGAEVDPVFTASDAFPITAAEIASWNAHPGLTTGTHGVTGTIVGTSDVQALTNKQLTMSNAEPIYWDDPGGVDVEVFTLWWGTSLDILTNEECDVLLWQGSGTGQKMVLWPDTSTAVSTLKDSPTLDFNANYWDGLNKNWEATIIHDMITAGATPKSRLTFGINSVNILRLENDNGTVKTYSDGVLDMTTHQINNVADPTLAQDAATKNYVDTAGFLLAEVDPVFLTTFDADTFLYASVDNTPVATSPADALAALSGHAAASFGWNNQELDKVGHIGVGTNNAARTDVGINYEEVITITDDVERLGLIGAPYVQKTTAAYNSMVVGVKGHVLLAAGNTQNWIYTVGMVGTEGFVQTIAGSTGTVNAAYSLFARCTVANAATMTRWDGLHVQNPTVAGGKLTNAYGAYWENITTGATLNYQIFMDTGTTPIELGDHPVYSLKLGEAMNANSQNITSLGTLNTHTVPAGTGTLALTSDISTHAALTTGVHGVGANYVAETSVEDLDLAGHASRHGVGGADTIFPADPGADRYLLWDDGLGSLTWIVGGGGAIAFTDLTDTFAYAGLGGKYVRVKATEDGLETGVPGGAGDMLIATYDPASISEQLVGLTANQTLSTKTLTTPIIASLYQAGGGGLISVPASVGADTICLLGATQELDAKTLDSSVAKGTWTSSSWGIPAGTLQGTITLNGKLFDAGAISAEIDTTGAGYGLTIKSTQDGTTGARLFLHTLSASPAAFDEVGGILFRGNNSVGALQTYGGIFCYSSVVVAGSEESYFEFWTHTASNANKAMVLSGAGTLSVDLSGTGTPAQVDLFDEYDDAEILRQGISGGQLDVLEEIGVIARGDTSSGWSINVQKMFSLLAGGIYQNRGKIDNLEKRISDLERMLLDN